MRADTRLELLKRLIRLSIGTEARVANDVTACLRLLKPDGETLAAYLADIKSSLAPPAAKGAKRGRVSVGGTASSTSRAERLPELIALLESVDIADVAASHALLLNLFEILASLVDFPSAPGQTDVSYPGQLVLTALSRVVDKVTPESGITGDSIRMTPVLDFMRSSVNPQTYHQSLLLLAQLGPLVPDQLVHNVMPIFTFMGANVLQRDDAYSLRVVDQTLDSIIPALVKATQKTARGRDALLKELKELLRSFTDAAAHVPRHRRINLFVRLVETLGPKEFLSAIVMLLVDKEGKATFDSTALPLALVEHFAVDVQLAAYRQIVDELTEILNLEVSFLSDSTTETPSPAQAKEQATNLLGALGYILEAKQLLSKVDSARAAGSETVDPTLTELVRGLLDLASAIAPAFSAEDRLELSEAAEYDVHAAIALLSIKAFADALLWLLEMADPSVQPRVFALLRARLPHVKPTRRADLTPAIIAVIETAQTRLGEDGETLEITLETLDTIADAAVAEEDAALAKIVPSLVSLAGDEQKTAHTRSKALEVLKKLTCVSPVWARAVPDSIADWPCDATATALDRDSSPSSANSCRLPSVSSTLKRKVSAIRVLLHAARHTYTSSRLNSRRGFSRSDRGRRVRDARGFVRLGPGLYRRTARQDLLGRPLDRRYGALGSPRSAGHQGARDAPLDGCEKVAGQDALPGYRAVACLALGSGARAAARFARFVEPRLASRQDERRCGSLPEHLQAVLDRV